MSQSHSVSTFAALSTFIGACTNDQLRTFTTALGGNSLASVCSAYARTGKREFAEFHAVEGVFRGILQTLVHGNNTRLAGFTTASRKNPVLFRVFQTLGVCDETGKVLLSKEPGLTKSSEELALESAVVFSAHVFSMAQELKRADSEKRKTEKAEREAKKPAPTENAQTENAQTENAQTDTGIPKVTAGDILNAVMAQIVAGAYSDAALDDLIDVINEAKKAKVPAPAPAPAPAKGAKKAKGAKVGAAPL